MANNVITVNPSIRINAINFFDKHYGPYYDHFSQPRGAALLINIREYDPSIGVSPRLYSEIDLADLEGLFTDIGYKVFPHSNVGIHTSSSPGTPTLANVTQNFLNEFKNNQYQSCVIVLMTHGCIDDQNRQYVAFYDHFYSTDAFLKPIVLSDVLLNIPKLVFIQACQTGCGNPAKPKSDGPFQLPTPRDTFVFYSCLLGSESFRTSNGSPFIKAICKIIGRDAHQSQATINELSKRIITETHLAMRKIYQDRNCQLGFFTRLWRWLWTSDEWPLDQIPCILPGLTKPFHFFPIHTVVPGFARNA